MPTIPRNALLFPGSNIPWIQSPLVRYRLAAPFHRHCGTATTHLSPLKSAIPAIAIGDGGCLTGIRGSAHAITDCGFGHGEVGIFHLSAEGTPPTEHQKLINDCGLGGWELVCVVCDNIQVVTYFFKRPIDRVVH